MPSPFVAGCYSNLHPPTFKTLLSSTAWLVKWSMRSLLLDPAAVPDQGRLLPSDLSLVLARTLRRSSHQNQRSPQSLTKMGRWSQTLHGRIDMPQLSELARKLLRGPPNYSMLRLLKCCKFIYRGHDWFQFVLTAHLLDLMRLWSPLGWNMSGGPRTIVWQWVRLCVHTLSVWLTICQLLDDDEEEVGRLYEDCLSADFVPAHIPGTGCNYLELAPRAPDELLELIGSFYSHT